MGLTVRIHFVVLTYDQVTERASNPVRPPKRVGRPLERSAVAERRAGPGRHGRRGLDGR